MNSAEEITIKVPGFNLATKMWGPKEGKPILCLHGKLDNAASFDLLAPLLPHARIVAVDYPGTGLSTPYQEGVIPHWKNDALLMLHLLKALEWQHCDIIAHSLGSLLATMIAMAAPKQIDHLVFLDILGPTTNFSEHRQQYFNNDIRNYLSTKPPTRKIYANHEEAIQDRMQIGNISHQAAEALVARGVTQNEQGWSWTFDRRLHGVSTTLPYEDELQAMFQTLSMPVCLIQAKQGVSYPKKLFHERALSIKQLITHEIDGGHHVHMDNPLAVATLIIDYLNLETA